RRSPSRVGPGGPPAPPLSSGGRGCPPRPPPAPPAGSWTPRGVEKDVSGDPRRTPGRALSPARAPRPRGRRRGDGAAERVTGPLRSTCPEYHRVRFVARPRPSRRLGG